MLYILKSRVSGVNHRETEHVVMAKTASKIGCDDIFSYMHDDSIL